MSSIAAILRKTFHIENTEAGLGSATLQRPATHGSLVPIAPAHGNAELVCTSPRMASLKLITAILLAGIAYASAQAIVDNLYPKAGDICRDRGTSWAKIKLGPCAKGTVCQAYKRGVYKCVPLDRKLGQMPINTVCYNETKVNQPDRKAGEAWRTYYRQRNCVWQGTDVQGTPKVQCVQTQEKGGIYRCKQVIPLAKKGCYVVSGSMIWGKYNDNQAYDACNGCPCTRPGFKGKYPLCRCQDTCDAARQKQMCATD